MVAPVLLDSPRAKIHVAKFPRARKFLRDRGLSWRDIDELGGTGEENWKLMKRALKFAVTESAKPVEKSRFDMRAWIGLRNGKGVVTEVHPADVSLKSRSYPGCGTTACLAGTAYLLTTDLPKSLTENALNKIFMDVQPEAQSELGLTSDQAEILFHMTTNSLPVIAETASYFVGKDLRGVFG